jgi:malonate-semialdehyde dehydrogenase (acetylating) / methylmalonate-semialdehyde dehydrogenase
VTSLPHWIGGREDWGTSTREGTIYDPARGTAQRSVQLANDADVDRAVAVAVAAFSTWGQSSLSSRVPILFAFRELVLKHASALAELISSEHGKVLADARGEVQRGLEVIEFACGIPHLLKGEYSDTVSLGTDSFSIRQPLGVVVGITPFNFPAMVQMWMFPIAIAAGNCFVLKPSERDPSVSVRLGHLWKEAGLPDGVFNVVHGDAETVNRLLVHPDVAAVSFVGSTPVARHVHETASRHGKRVQALGGAKNHMVVMPDAALDVAADAAVNAAFGSAGQRCMAISVVVAVGDVADALVPRIAERVRAIKVGSGDDPAADMGPLVTAAARDRVLSCIDDGVTAGATLVTDGRDVAIAGFENGFYVGPCLFDHVTATMRIYREEIFGPVLCVVRVDSLHDAIALVNSSAFANGVAVFTSDGATARRFVHDIEVGMVGINVPIPVPMAYHSFGGWKSSLFGDMHVHGPEGVRFYTRAKVVTARWPEAAPTGKDLAFPSVR